MVSPFLYKKIQSLFSRGLKDNSIYQENNKQLTLKMAVLKARTLKSCSFAASVKERPLRVLLRFMAEHRFSRETNPRRKRIVAQILSKINGGMTPSIAFYFFSHIFNSYVFGLLLDLDVVTCRNVLCGNRKNRGETCRQGRCEHLRAAAVARDPGFPPRPVPVRTALGCGRDDRG